MIKLSNYEIMMPLDDAYFLLVNGLYCAIDVVDQEEGKALAEGKFESLSDEKRKRLLARGHLTESLETELEDLKLMAGYYRKYRAESELALLILPTYDCNFRCPYCFERHRLSRGQEWLHKTMSKELVDAIFKAVEKEKERGVKARSKCPYVFVCGGGCAACAYRETGSISDQYCGEVKEIFRDSATEVCREIFYNKKERELTKSLKELVTNYSHK